LGFGPGVPGGVSSASTPLKDFLTEMQTEGLAWPNRFCAQISPPQIIQQIVKLGQVRPSIADNGFLQKLILRIDMAELPGYSFMTSDTRTYAPIMKIPSQILYQDLNLSFLVSANMAEKYFFDYWCYAMRDPNNLFEYYDHITGDIEVTIYNVFNQPVYGIKFIQCWPSSVAPVTLSWQDQEYMRLTVSFTYHHWEPVGHVPQDLSQPALAPETGTNQILSDLLFNVLPSVPGGSKFLGFAGMNSSQLIKAGVSILGNSVKTTDPISRTLIAAGTNTFDKFFGNGGP